MPVSFTSLAISAACSLETTKSSSLTMTQNHSTILGTIQERSFGTPLLLSGRYSSGMMAPNRNQNVSLPERLARNVKYLRDVQFGTEGDPTRALAKKAKLGHMTVFRVVKGSHSSTLRTVQALAEALGVDAVQLLAKDMTLYPMGSVAAVRHREPLKTEGTSHARSSVQPISKPGRNRGR